MFAYPIAVEYLSLPSDEDRSVREAPPPAYLVEVEQVPPSAVATLTEKLGVTEAQVVRAAGMASRTWHTRKANGTTLSDREADAILRIARIAAEAGEVFGSNAKGRRWLTTPQAMLGGREPFDLLDSDAGVQVVEEALGRIRWGDLA